MIVGLTGGIGSGKSTVAKMFAEQNNVAIYIADKEAKELVNTSKTIKTKIIDEFGDKAYNKNILNREYISNIVFKNPEKLQKLNKIIHPEVRNHFLNFKKINVNKSYIVYEAAILFEAKADLLCDKIITVFTDKTTRLKRVMQRDNISKYEVENRMQNQWDESKKILLSNYVIWNDDLTKTQLQVKKIHNILTNNRKLV